MSVHSPTTEKSDNTVIATRQTLILLSPLFVLAVCQIAGRLFTPIFGNDSVYLWLLVYWAITGGLIYWGGGPNAIRRWAAKPRGSWVMSALALIFLPVTFLIFLDGGKHLLNGWLWLPWLIFAPLNSIFEEGYWRGLLFDAGRRWPGWSVILYTTLFFALNHLSLGTFALVYRSWFPIISPVAAGLLYGLIYWRTGSLRWVVISHTLVNWFSLGILVLMNVYIPITP